MKIPLLLMMLAALAVSQLRADDDKPEAVLPAANAINAVGVDLLAKTPRGENALISPYSIECALAMTYAGAAGKTRDEMAVTLHLPKDADALNASFAQLQRQMEGEQDSIAHNLAEQQKNMAANQQGGRAAPMKPPEPAFILSVANRLYGQAGYAFRAPFLSLMKESYNAPMQEIDFEKAPGDAVKTINDWVSDHTHGRIKNLVPLDAITTATQLVLVNAIYFKGVWDSKFDKQETKPGVFHLSGGQTCRVPMMQGGCYTGYVKRDGYTAVNLRYIGKGVQFLILLPDGPNGLPALEAKLTPAMLAGFTNFGHDFHLVELWLPKFKLEPQAMELSQSLKALGMKTAFDDPEGSADFDGMAPRKPDDYLFISRVFHKTFLSLDEDGTEAAGATAVLMLPGSGGLPEEKLKEVHVDRPFLFAIQDCSSGACLFLGRVTDPR